MEETEIWEGQPSHHYFLTRHILCVIFAALGVTAMPWAFWFGLILLLVSVSISTWAVLVINTWNIRITSERIITEKGVLSKTTDELELFRVKDIRLDEPFIFRMLGLSNIVLVTSDKTNPKLRVSAIEKGKDLRETLRKTVEERRKAKGVVERDYD
jgi:uncharacterized membrane protein YdbT with pleckstrin-like domain